MFICCLFGRHRSRLLFGTWTEHVTLQEETNQRWSSPAVMICIILATKWSAFDFPAVFFTENKQTTTALKAFHRELADPRGSTVITFDLHRLISQRPWHWISSTQMLVGGGKPIRVCPRMGSEKESKGRVNRHQTTLETFGNLFGDR